MRDESDLTAWVVRKDRASAGARYPVRSDVVRIGRSAENDIVLDNEPRVSARHLEIRRADGAYRLFDLNSTNGTFLDGKRVKEAALQPPVSIRLGTDGPELAFVAGDAPSDTNQTLIAATLPPLLKTGAARDKRAGPAIGGEHEKLLSGAVERARLARRRGAYNETAGIMLEMLGKALHQTSRRFKAVIAGLVVALAGVSAYGFWQIANLKREKRALDGQMQNIEALVERANQDPAETDKLLARLDQYEDQARALEGTVLYRIGAREREDLVSSEIRSLMAEFGAETYSIPPEFRDEVNRFIQQYQGPDRRNMERVLGEARPSMQSMQKVFEHDHLPPDLAYMALVESVMGLNDRSRAGALGLWQFTPATAKQYGLRVDGKVDERRNARKSTEAACKYIRDLILDFGAGSSVMLAMAAYNLGPAKVKQAVRAVSDPIKQRNFWYLYRIRALPVETREYVPKVIAAMIIGRHPERFDF